MNILELGHQETKRSTLALALLLLLATFAHPANAEGFGVAVVSKMCGEAEMSLRCKPRIDGKLDCLHPLLILKERSGHFSKMATPSGMEKYSPVGLACAVSSKEHDSYFVVEFGELPEGCEYCEWFHLYDKHGKLLTSSNPAIQTITGMESPRDKVPNNSDFTAFSKKLGLGMSKEEYLQCDGDPLDEKGKPTCFKEL